MQVRLPGEFQDPGHGETAFVGQSLFGGSLGLHLFEDFSAQLNPHDVGVVVDNAHQCHRFPGPGSDRDVKDEGGIRQLHSDGSGLQVLLDEGVILGRHLGQDFQLQVGISSGHTGGSGGGDAPQAAGTRYEYAFHVFDDVSAGFHLHAVGLSSQSLPGDGGSIGNGDGLGAAHGGHQLFL